MKKVKVFSSGRINFIGEHIDYIGGVSIPAAINLYTEIKITLLNQIKHKDKKIDEDNFKIIVNSFYFEQVVKVEPYSFKIKVISNNDNKNNLSWINYIIGVLKFLENIGIGINFPHRIDINGNLPVSVGLSSSASLIIGLISAYNKLLNLKLSNNNLIEYARIIENRYLNSPCGYLDQYAIVYGKKDNFIYIDFRDFTTEYLKLKNNFIFYVLDSGIKHSIAGEGYGNRIKEKQEIEKIIKIKTGFSIRDYIDHLIESYKLINEYNNNEDAIYKNSKNNCLKNNKNNYLKDKFKNLEKVIEKENVIKDKILQKRFLHFLSEILRVYLFKNYIKIEQYIKAFNLINESHYSLSKFYEVSPEEIEFLVSDLRKKEDIFWGTRIIGGGFGGSILTVVEKSKKEEADIIINKLKKKYKKNFNIDLKYFKTSLEDGLFIY